MSSEREVSAGGVVVHDGQVLVIVPTRRAADGSRVLELSTKCEPGEAFQVAAETRAFLASKGIDLEGEQQTKTRTALEYFAKHLEAPA